jgi:hypothetical protein
MTSYYSHVKNNINMSENCKCAEPTPTVEEKKFEVTVVVSEKYYNEELKKYLFSFERDYTVMISETPEVTFETSELWRLTDYLYAGGITQLKIKVK